MQSSSQKPTGKASVYLLAFRVAPNSWPGRFQSTPCQERKYMNSAPPTLALLQATFRRPGAAVTDERPEKRNERKGMRVPHL